MKKIISILLCVTLILCTLAPLAHAQSDECNCGETPLIYVGPLGSTSIYLNPDTDEEVQLFRLTTDTVLKLVGGILPALVLLGITRNYDAFGDSVIKVINETMGMLALDGDGNSFENVSAKREMPTGTEHGKGTDYYFSYDWRLSPIEVAGQLKEFVEEVKRLTELRNRAIIELKGSYHAGLEEGILQEKLSIARQMLKNNFSIEDIIKCTNLSKEDILGLKNDI